MTPEDAAPERASPGEGSKAFRSIGIAVAVIVLVGLGVWFWLSRAEPAPEAAPEVEPVAVAEPPPAPPPPPLPDLDGSDAFLSALFAALTANPDALAWLLGEDLARQIVVAVESVAEGESPRRPLAGLGPREAFATEEVDGELVIAPASFARYDGLAAAISEADAAGVAAAVQRVLPLLEEAYAELGRPDRTFREALLAALDRLVAVPLPQAPIRVREATLRYQYLDPRLEGLDEASKHLLRFGPDNQRRVQTALADLRAAIQSPAP